MPTNNGCAQANKRVKPMNSSHGGIHRTCSMSSSEDIDGARGQERDDYQRDDRLEHHEGTPESMVGYAVWVRFFYPTVSIAW
jgi:hypothetical protein